MNNLLKSHKGTPKENRQEHKTRGASPAELESTHNEEAILWNDLTRNNIDYLRSLAALCRLRAAKPNDEKFAALLDKAHRSQVITEQMLAEMAGVDRSTANRWLNQKAILRTPLAQSAIMKEIAKLSDAQADELEFRMKEDASIPKRDMRAS